MTAAQQRKETHEEDPLEQPERGRQGCSPHGGAAGAPARLRPARGETAQGGHTWDRPAAGLEVDRAPARLRPEGEKLQRAGGRGPDGVPNGSRPLASTPRLPGKPHATECYQHQHAAFNSNFRLNKIRRSMSWSH